MNWLFSLQDQENCLTTKHWLTVNSICDFYHASTKRAFSFFLLSQSKLLLNFHYRWDLSFCFFFSSVILYVIFYFDEKNLFARILFSPRHYSRKRNKKKSHKLISMMKHDSLHPCCTNFDHIIYIAILLSLTNVNFFKSRLSQKFVIRMHTHLKWLFRMK